MVSLLIFLACSGESSGPDTGTEIIGDTEDTGVVTETDWELTCSDHNNLEILVVDHWGHAVDAEVALDHAVGWVDGLIPLGANAVTLTVGVTAADHQSATARISYSGETSQTAFTFDEPTGGARIVAAYEPADCPVATVLVGLDHLWFASTANSPSLNEVTFLQDGQETWQSVYDLLSTATQRVSWSTWWWESDFQLVRDHSMGLAERESYGVLAVLQDQAGVEKRVLVNNFWEELSSELLNTDEALRDLAEASNDDFDVILQANRTSVPVEGVYEGTAAEFSLVERLMEHPDHAQRSFFYGDWPASSLIDIELEAASFHQKFVVVDGQAAVVSGMNTKAVDWDTPLHKVFDSLRMEIDASNTEREDVADRLEFPDTVPRKDYGIKLRGPAARDVEEVMWKRWEYAIEQGEQYSEYATKFDLMEPAAPGSTPAQIVQTLPEPWGDMSILETHGKAFAQAESLIYIEDQYFRSPILNEIIAARMLMAPDLLLVVVTSPISEWDPGLKYTYLSDQYFKELFPDRYLLLHLETFDMVTTEDFILDDAVFYRQAMSTHSKLRIVDDRYLSLGSCNFNNRGYLYEGEMNAVVLDKAFTTAARNKVFENLVGPQFAALLSGDAQNDFDVLAGAAEHNAEAAAWWEKNDWYLTDVDDAESKWEDYQPSGFLLPLTLQSDYFEVGPDLF
jgi:phosphatidylserine/phosphatidylglycerophosphate/cardiolipin synthase-like enzyme